MSTRDAVAGFQKPPELPRILISETRAAYLGPGLDLAPHRNTAATLAISLEQPFALRLHSAAGEWRDWQSETIWLIPSGTTHHLRAQGAMVFVYLDALSDDERALRTADLTAARLRLLDLPEHSNLAQIGEVLGLPQRTFSDPRIAEVIRRLDATPQDFHTIEAAALQAHLSPSRFRNLFMAEVGLPFRRYRLWRRMINVMHALAQGRTLTEAAHDTGFSSSAHLSSAFKQMFGLAPAGLLATGINIEFSGALLSPWQGRVQRQPAATAGHATGQ